MGRCEYCGLPDEHGPCPDCSAKTLAALRALVDALEVSFHSRIRYPWQEKATAKKGSLWTFGSGDRDKQPQSRSSSFKM